MKAESKAALRPIAAMAFPDVLPAGQGLVRAADWLFLEPRR